MEAGHLKAVIEGLIFASGDEGITVKQISKVLEMTESVVSDLVEELKLNYEHAYRGLMLMESRGVIHLTTKPEHSHYYKKLVETPNLQRLSQAALETLAIIAYRQPITRIEIDEIRGVKSEGTVQTLLNRSLIENLGRTETIGRPIVFGTSKDFLTFFGLTSIDELPPLPENDGQDDSNQEIDLFFDKFNEQ